VERPLGEETAAASRSRGCSSGKDKAMSDANQRRPQVVLIGLVLILPMAACGLWRTPTPDARGDVTVFNRTANALTVTDADETFTVLGCGEASASNFRINRWKIADRFGRDEFSSDGGSFGPHAYILVTVDSAPRQTDTRPSNQPPCQGIPGRFHGAALNPTRPNAPFLKVTYPAQ
jgi:hypothetical protein